MNANKSRFTGQNKVFEYLIANGANIESENNKMHTAINVAAENGNDATTATPLRQWFDK